MTQIPPRLPANAKRARLLTCRRPIRARHSNLNRRRRIIAVSVTLMNTKRESLDLTEFVLFIIVVVFELE